VSSKDSAYTVYLARIAEYIPHQKSKNQYIHD